MKIKAVVHSLKAITSDNNQQNRSTHVFKKPHLGISWIISEKSFGNVFEMFTQQFQHLALVLFDSSS